MIDVTPRAIISGFGNAGRLLHLPLLRAAGFNVSAVVATSPSARDRAERLGLPVVAALNQLDGPRPDLVVIAVPDEAHEDHFNQALLLGARTVVVEKPVATSSRAATRMSEAARSAGSVLVPFHNRRWDGDYLTLKQLVADGAIGELTRVTSRITHWTPAVGDTWRDRTREGLSGKLADLGTHVVDQLVDLLGPAQRVYAEIDSVRDPHGSNDDCFLALHHSTGAWGHAHVSAISSAVVPRFVAQGLAGSYQIDGVDPQQRQLLAGMKPGSAGWGLDTSRQPGILTGETTGPVPTVAGDWTTFYQSLRRSLRNEDPPPVSADDAIHVLRVLEAAQESASSGRVVALDATRPENPTSAESPSDFS